MVLEDLLFLLLQFFTRSPPVHPYFYPSIFVFTRPNDGWMGLYIKLKRITLTLTLTLALNMILILTQTHTPILE